MDALLGSNNVCEACRRSPVQAVVESEEPQQPYRLCSLCADRLQKYALRPLEWFNLASVHSSSKYFLHDDFYSDDGVADQSETPVEEPEKYPAPTLEQVAGNEERLIDYAMARFMLREDVTQELKNHDKEAILQSLIRRIETSHNIEIECRAYEICATVLQEMAEAWIRERWNQRATVAFHSLALAVANCLPHDEGLSLILHELERVQPQDRPFACTALARFRSPKALEWIETFIDYPVTDDWGRLAAVSQFSWNTITRWLERGRPLSLVAIDALYFCVKRDTKILKDYAPKLSDHDTVENMTAALNQYTNTDPVPRVERRIGVILGNWDQILAG